MMARARDRWKMGVGSVECGCGCACHAAGLPGRRSAASGYSLLSASTSMSKSMSLLNSRGQCV